MTSVVIGVEMKGNKTLDGNVRFEWETGNQEKSVTHWHDEFE